MRRLITIGAALLAFGACGSNDEGAAGAAAAEGAPNAAAAGGGYASPDGRAEVRSDAAFSGLPEGIPPYPRPDGRGAIQMGGNSDGNEMRVIGFGTADPPETVIAFYAEAGPRAGFREGHRTVSGPSHVLGLERADAVMNVTATGAPGGTRVQIMVGSR